MGMVEFYIIFIIKCSLLRSKRPMQLNVSALHCNGCIEQILSRSYGAACIGSYRTSSEWSREHILARSYGAARDPMVLLVLVATILAANGRLATLSPSSKGELIGRLNPSSTSSAVCSSVIHSF